MIDDWRSLIQHTVRVDNATGMMENISNWLKRRRWCDDGDLNQKQYQTEMKKPLSLWGEMNCSGYSFSPSRYLSNKNKSWLSKDTRIPKTEQGSENGCCRTRLVPCYCRQQQTTKREKMFFRSVKIIWARRPMKTAMRGYERRCFPKQRYWKERQ